MNSRSKAVPDSSWYAKLNYGNFEIIIPQNSISDAYIKEDDEKTVSLDDIIWHSFSNENNEQNGSLSVLCIGGKKYTTSRMPEICSANDGSAAGMCDILASVFFKRGITGIRFGREHIQYIVDIAKLHGEA